MSSWWHPSAPDERELIRETEAFLAGNYAGYLRSRGWRVPPWAWLNGLAHGDAPAVDELTSEPSITDRDRGTTALWQQAVAFLAQEVLTRCAHQTLRDLQRSALVPLELRLAAEGSWTMDPGELVAAVMEALQQRPASYRP